MMQICNIILQPFCKQKYQHMSDKYDINTPQYLRIRILDKLLASKRKYTRSELKEKVMEEMNEMTDIVKPDELNYPDRTFANDKKYLENKLAVLNDENGLTGSEKYCIIVDKEHRYYYSHPLIPVFENKMDVENIQKLTGAVQLLKQIKGFDHDDEIKSILQGLDQQIKISSTDGDQIISLQHLVADGYHYLDDLYNAIIDKSVIEIEYEPFGEETTQKIVHPYFLKQYNNRWFLFGYDESRKNISNFALDRIKRKPKGHSTEYLLPENRFNPHQYFKNIIGVTNYTHNPVENIILLFSKERAPYIISKKIHDTQEILEKKEDGSTLIKLQVKQNFELKSFLLSQGSHVTVLAPQSLALEIANELKQTLARYSGSTS